MEWPVTRVHLEYVQSVVSIRDREPQDAIKTARACERRIKELLPI
jgi:hypothetical protein